MIKGKLKPTQIAFNLLCLILLLISTTVILFVTKKDIASADYQLDDAGYNGAAGVQWAFQESNLTRDVEVEGWAFAETELDNPNKQAKLIFVSDKHSYSVDAELFDEAWAKNYYTDLKVPALKNGYNAKFSPLRMKDGVYSLFVQVVENETDSGTFYTYSDFNKSNDSFTRVVTNTKITDLDFSQTVTTELVKWYIEECEVRGEKLYVSGWALHQNQHSLSNRLFIEIRNPDGTTDYYATTRVYLDGVGKQFGDNKYNMAGFYVEIPLAEIGHGDISISTLIGTNFRTIDDYVFHLD